MIPPSLLLAATASVVSLLSAVPTTAFISPSVLHPVDISSRRGCPKAWGSISHTSRDGNACRTKIIPRRSFLASNPDEGVETDVSRKIGIIIAGAPASGKGTQCESIVRDYGVIHLSTGDMLRAAVAAGSPVGKSAKDYMDAGKLVPDEVIIGVVKDRLSEADCQSDGWLLDGFPRTPGQAEALAAAGVTADCFIFLNVPDSVLVERVVGRRTDPDTGKIYHMTFSPPEDPEVLARLVQRSDDTEEKVVVRLEQFHANVEAVRGYYKDIAVTIDGTSSPVNVAEEIKTAVKGKLLEA